MLLKYRVPGFAKLPKSGAYPQAPQALEDAQRTISLSRLHAAEWRIDPRKSCVMGFSAVVTLWRLPAFFEKHIYLRIDVTDDIGYRPNFAIAIYPGHLMVAENSFGLQHEVKSHLSKQTPLTFLLQNKADEVDGVEQALSYYAGLKHARVPVEMLLTPKEDTLLACVAPIFPQPHGPSCWRSGWSRSAFCKSEVEAIPRFRTMR